jgi:hypothetical protein
LVPLAATVVTEDEIVARAGHLVELETVSHASRPSRGAPAAWRVRDGGGPSWASEGPSDRSR